MSLVRTYMVRHCLASFTGLPRKKKRKACSKLLYCLPEKAEVGSVVLKVFKELLIYLVSNLYFNISCIQLFIGYYWRMGCLFYLEACVGG